MKKRITSLVLILALLLVSVPFTAQANPHPVATVAIDGVPMTFGDQQPIIVDARTLVPVRGVFERLGFIVDWYETPMRMAVIRNAQYEIRIPIDSAVFTTNGAAHMLDVPAQIIGERTLVPIRLPLESVGFSFDWDGVTRTVHISTQPTPTPTPTPAPDILPVHITVAPNTLTLTGGETGQLTATVQPANATNSTVTWTSSNTAVATVNSEGRVQAVGSGTATITATTHNNLAASATVTVRVQSTITLPNRRATTAERDAWIADYTAQGGSNAFERDIVRLINEIREEHGLLRVNTDTGLMQAARYYTQLKVNLNLRPGHNVGPYRTEGATHGASTAIAEAFGGRLYGNRGSYASGRQTPQEIVDTWMDTPAQRSFILQPAHRHIGVGTFEGGTHNRITYMFLTNQASVTGVPPTGVTISPSAAATINRGATRQLTANVQPAAATNRTVTWTSSNTSIATVSSNGLVTGGQTVGTATITATTVNGLTATVQITVTDGYLPTSIAFASFDANIPAGTTRQLTVNFTPTNVPQANRTLTWSSSNTNIATVSPTGLVNVSAYANANQTFSITATSTLNSAATATATFTITAGNQPTGVTITSPPPATMTVGQTHNLAATVQPSAANQNVTWSSSNNNVATISGNVVTAVGAGTVTITATTVATPQRTATVTFTVNAVQPTHINVTPSLQNLTVGQPAQSLNAAVLPVGVAQTVTWSSNNPSVADVNANTGVITLGGGTGTATITATSTVNPSATGTATIHVTHPQYPTAIQFSPPTMQLASGGSARLTPVITPGNAINQNVTWSSDNPDVATVDDGIVRAHSAGQATITARTANNLTATVTITVPDSTSGGGGTRG